MRNPTQLQQALRKIGNVSSFCRRHRLAERTVWRIRSGGTARRGTLVMLDQALNADAAALSRLKDESKFPPLDANTARIPRFKKGASKEEAIEAIDVWHHKG